MESSEMKAELDLGAASWASTRWPRSFDRDEQTCRRLGITPEQIADRLEALLERSAWFEPQGLAPRGWPTDLPREALDSGPVRRRRRDDTSSEVLASPAGRPAERQIADTSRRSQIG